jgi:hypothetical protein
MVKGPLLDSDQKRLGPASYTQEITELCQKIGGSRRRNTVVEGSLACYCLDVLRLNLHHPAGPKYEDLGRPRLPNGVVQAASLPGPFGKRREERGGKSVVDVSQQVDD